MGEVSIADHEPQVDEFRYTLFGSKLAADLGADYTGKLITEVRPRSFAALAREHYHRVKDTGSPSVHCLVIGGHQSFLRFLRLLLPLTNRGWGVDSVIAVAAATFITGTLVGIVAGGPGRRLRLPKCVCD